MNDIIDNDFTNSRSSLDFPTICRWLLIGVLGCIVFQSYENFIQIVSSHLLIAAQVLGINTSIFVSNIIGLVFTLVVFSIIIGRLKKLFENNTLDLIKTIRLLIASYVVCVVLQLSFNLLSESIGLMNTAGQVPEMIDIGTLSAINGVYYMIETVVKYGFIISVLLSRS